MQGNPNQQYNPPPEPLYSYVQQFEDGLDGLRDAEQRAREIGYRIDYYPQQTTGQNK
jgi:hypothetical protein